MGQESSTNVSYSVHSEQLHKRDALSEKLARSIGVELYEVSGLSQFLLRNGYKLYEAELGRGNSAVVFAASSIDHQIQAKPLAMKLVKCITPGKDQDIIKEFNILRSLQTPHVIEAVDLLQYTSPCNVIILSVIEQCKYTLHALLRERKSLNPLEILNIFHQLSLGLNSIHSQDILHLDIKPSNIMLGFDGNWKYIDMEVSMILPDNNRLAVSSGITQMYCSPEQLQDSYLSYQHHSQGKITKSSDIYSLGLVFCEILGGLQDKRQVIQHKSKETNRTAVLIDYNILSQFEQQIYEQLVLPMIQLNPIHRIDIKTVLMIVNQLQMQLAESKQQSQELLLFTSEGQKYSPVMTPKSNNSSEYQDKQSLKIKELSFSLSDRNYSNSTLNNSIRNSQNFENSKHNTKNQFSIDFLIKDNNSNSNNEPALGQFNTKYLFNQKIHTLNSPNSQ